jgi:hypothetical protein
VRDFEFSDLRVAKAPWNNCIVLLVEALLSLAFSFVEELAFVWFGLSLFFDLINEPFLYLMSLDSFAEVNW